LRLDLRGDQNLDIPSLYQEHMVDQVELAMDSLHSLPLRRSAALRPSAYVPGRSGRSMPLCAGATLAPQS
jgi:hypothetical protein